MCVCVCVGGPLSSSAMIVSDAIPCLSSAVRRAAWPGWAVRSWLAPLGVLAAHENGNSIFPNIFVCAHFFVCFRSFLSLPWEAKMEEMFFQSLSGSLEKGRTDENRKKKMDRRTCPNSTNPHMPGEKMKKEKHAGRTHHFFALGSTGARSEPTAVLCVGVLTARGASPRVFTGVW